MKTGLICLLAGLASLAWLSQPVVAQITTGSITGKAVDEKGEVLPGVLITARDPETGLERAAPTDTRGEYRLLGLPPTTYVVQATLTGYGALPKTVVVNIGQIVPLNFDMKPGGGLEERVEVTAEQPILNTTKTELSTVVSEQQVRSYPLIQRDYNDLAQLAPGVKAAPTGQFDPTKKESIYAPFTTGLGSGRNVNISIDGADNNDNVVGFFVQGFTTEGIQEFEVIQDQYKAEYGRSLGGVVNVITKSGTNDFSGSVFGYFNNESLRAKEYGERLNALDKSEVDREFFGFSVGGPIVKDKLFYFLALERQNDDRPTALSPLLTQFAGTEPAGFPFQIASPGSVSVLDFARDLWTVKLNWNASANHLLWLRWSRDNADTLNDQGGDLTDPSNQGASKNDIWSAVLNWQWNIGGNKINELKIHRNDFENRIVSLSPDPILTLDFANFSLGRNINAPQATFQNKFQIRDDFTWIRGKHTFKTGFEGVRVDLGDSFLGPSKTPSLEFVFNSQYNPDASMAAGDADGDGFDDGLEVISELVLVNPGFIPGTQYTQLGAYFQDDWEFSDRWRFNLGLRVDRDHDLFKDAKKGINRDFYECFADPTDHAKCGRDPNTPNPPPGFHGFENTFPENPTNISPRLGFVYRVAGQEQDVFRGSWGLFYDKLIDNLVIFMRQNVSPVVSPILPALLGCPEDAGGVPDCSGTQLTAGTVVDPRLPPLPADFSLANWLDPSSGLQGWFGTLTSILGEATFDDAVFIPSPDWKTPYTSAFSVGWGHSFSPRLALDLNAIWRRGFHQLTRQSFRGRQSGRHAPFPAGAIDPNTGLAEYPGIADFFTTDGKADYRALQGSLKGRFTNLDFVWNVNISRAAGTQDSGGTAPTDGGPIDIFEGGNIRFTGGDINDEWGLISGDQRFYTFLYGLYRLPLQFQVASQVAYGSTTAFQPFANVDLNSDGFNSLNEYRGVRGSGKGDDLFFINLRASKTFNTGKGTAAEIYADVFNLTNHVNHGLFVIHQQFDSPGVRFSSFEAPTGSTVTRPRTLQIGARFTF